MTTDTPTIGLGLDTSTGTPWVGPTPTHGVWDQRIQMFSFPPSDNAQAATPEQATTLLNALYHTLSLPPKARQPAPKGHIVRPSMQVACPKCRGEHLAVPVVATLTPDGIFEAWFGKGDCRCTSCGYVGTQAKVRSLSMYEYTDLVQERPEWGNRLVEKLQAHT